MDVLSDVVSVMRTGEPRSARVEWHGPWGQRFLPAPGGGFTVVLQGACWLLPEGGEPLTMGVGDVLFLPRGPGYALADHPSSPLAEAACDTAGGARREHRFGAPPAGGPATGDRAPTTVTLCGAYQLDTARAHPLLDELPDVLHLPAGVEQGTRIRAAVELLGGELAEPGLGTDTVVPALLDTMLLLILRDWFESRGRSGAVTTGWTAALADRAVGPALHAIHRDPAAAWTVADLADRAGLSRAAFARRFAALVGRPPLGYLTWWRMTVASRLLRESDLPLGALAARVGYGSESALTAAFKREYGTAPGRYRGDRRRA